MVDGLYIAIVNRKSPYLNEKSSDFDAIWYTNEYLELGGR